MSFSSFFSSIGSAIEDAADSFAEFLQSIAHPKKKQTPYQPTEF